MIIQIRGTSGSGKTWVMRSLLGPLPELVWETVYVEGRRRPLYYRGARGLYVLGSYEATCGGCDGIGSARAVFELYESILSDDPRAVILSEGLLLSEDFRWTLEAYKRGWEPRVAYLSTNVERCIEQIKARRKEAGTKKAFREDNTRYRVKVIERSKLKLESEGVMCKYVTPSKTTELVKGWIRDYANRAGLDRAS